MSTPIEDKLEQERIDDADAKAGDLHEGNLDVLTSRVEALEVQHV